MKNSFEIPVYSQIDGKFEIVDKKVYTITYKHRKITSLHVIVNEFMTKVVIDLNTHKKSYKTQLLKAISEYVHRDQTKNYPVYKKCISENSIYQVYNKQIVNNIKMHLLTINKEVNRDTLTEFGLI